MNLLDSKSGQLRNYLVIVIALFVTGFLSILALLLGSSLIDGFDDAGYLDTEAAQTAANGFLNAWRMMDWIMVILMIVFIIGIGITSYRLNTLPIFFVVTVVMAIFLGFISYFFSYLFAEMVSPSTFDAVLLFFPKTLLICTNLHWVSLAAVVVGSITLYGKKEPGGFS